MDFKQYQTQASRTINHSAEQALANHGLGLAGECGEVVELIKKHLYHGRPLDPDRLAEEIGDLLWYVAAVATSAGLCLDGIATTNISKLQARYPDGFKPASQPAAPTAPTEEHYAIADRWKLNTSQRSD